MILIIDNYDSFTYNLVQQIGALGVKIEVARNDKITLSEIESKNPSHIIISPGPCTPKEGGISNSVIKTFAGKIPTLGVCLGHQCLAYTFGAKIVRARRIMHGKTSMIYHDNKTIFKGLTNPFEATRYHSLIVNKETLPNFFETTAFADKDEIMGIRHKKFPLEGVQFHPESFLTVQGSKLIKNFLDY
ncbi:MAG: glutamine amidotransferase [Candidatus Scalindua rubra]|uniref:Glutamine amidotransferase n=1 Tax=Candidatus Scalindua rubra TaxID=1872076 RepID=A0A1E3XCI6_9BACT|nr:MAG: glutamine amidotransferase [Candidatus Scalindua rubra]